MSALLIIASCMKKFFISSFPSITIKTLNSIGQGQYKQLILLESYVLKFHQDDNYFRVFFSQLSRPWRNLPFRDANPRQLVKLASSSFWSDVPSFLTMTALSHFIAASWPISQLDLGSHDDLFHELLLRYVPILLFYYLYDETQYHIRSFHASHRENPSLMSIERTSSLDVWFLLKISVPEVSHSKPLLTPVQELGRLYLAAPLRIGFDESCCHSELI